METGTVRGVLIVESLRVGGTVAGVPLRIRALTRIDAPPEPVGGPPTWTFLEFEAGLDAVEQLSSSFANALDEAHGWYASFRSSDEMFVVFAGRQFRYTLGDPAGKAEAETYARSVGVPQSQLDWER